MTSVVKDIFADETQIPDFVFTANADHRNFIATLIVRPPQPVYQIDIYREPDTWTLSRFAVSPKFQGIGIGHQLHDAAIAYAGTNSGRWMALDTAEPAIGLIEIYLRWGYKIVGESDRRPQTNYPSIVMCKPIGCHDQGI